MDAVGSLDQKNKEILLESSLEIIASTTELSNSKPALGNLGAEPQLF